MHDIRRLLSYDLKAKSFLHWIKSGI